MPPYTPTVGFVYNIVCPSCYTTLQFKCESVYKSRIKCGSCDAIIDLRTATALNDASSSDEVSLQEPVQFSPEVELHVGCSSSGSAIDQVSAVMKKTAEENALPAVVSVETTTAVSEERAVALSQKLWIFHYLTYVVEFLLFGRTPYCKIGHIRVFRKKIPFLGYRYIPVPRTSTSYSFLSTIIFYYFCCACYAVNISQADWLRPYVRLLFVLMMILYINMLTVAYTDPGFVLPGYISGDENGGNQILNREAAYGYSEAHNILQNIEKGKKESRWQTVNGVPMERKWCSQCQIYRPVRAAHCYQCGLCVLVHDHHCVVTGGCVGRRNILFFAYFVFEGHCAAFLAGLVTALCLHYHTEAFSTFSYWWLMTTDVIFCWFLTAMAISLSLGLWYGMLFDVTTRERLQNVYFSKRNPFQRRCLRNLYYYVVEKKHEPSIFREEVMALWVSASQSKGNARV